MREKSLEEKVDFVFLRHEILKDLLEDISRIIGELEDVERRLDKLENSDE